MEKVSRKRDLQHASAQATEIDIKDIIDSFIWTN